MVIQILVHVIHFLTIIIVVDALLSWVQPDVRAFPRRVTHALTYPLLAPFRTIIPPTATGGIDFSPVLVIFLLIALRRALLAILVSTS